MAAAFAACDFASSKGLLQTQVLLMDEMGAAEVHKEALPATAFSNEDGIKGR